jgi:hypothetical protein
MLLPLPKKKNFEDCPVGPQRARVSEVTPFTEPVGGQIESKVRMLWDIEGYENHPERYVAGKSYKATLEEGSDLRTHLDSWLGGDYSSVIGKEGNVDLMLLLGRRGELFLRHGRPHPAHPKPFVNLDSVFPIGTFSFN